MDSAKFQATKANRPGRAVIYARVSSKDREREGCSMPAQPNLLDEYAADKGFGVAMQYVDVETAKEAGRRAFGDMTEWLRSDPDAKAMLVEKTDRLFRNFRDCVTPDDLGTEIHFVKEGVVPSEDSRSSAKFLQGVKVVMARNFSDNLSEEVQKGMIAKAEQGVRPTLAPLGYRNIANPDGRKVIAVDSETAPHISSPFSWYATGQCSIRNVARKAREAGLRHRRTGRPISTGRVMEVLRNRLYTGSFERKGKIHQGVHEPIVPVETWELVQEVLEGRGAKKRRRVKHEFAYAGDLNREPPGASR